MHASLFLPLREDWCRLRQKRPLRENFVRRVAASDACQEEAARLVGAAGARGVPPGRGFAGRGRGSGSGGFAGRGAAWAGLRGAGASRGGGAGSARFRQVFAGRARPAGTCGPPRAAPGGGGRRSPWSERRARPHARRGTQEEGLAACPTRRFMAFRRETLAPSPGAGRARRKGRRHRARPATWDQSRRQPLARGRLSDQPSRTGGTGAGRSRAAGDGEGRIFRLGRS